MIKKYKKKPIPVEVVQYDGTNGEFLRKWSKWKVSECFDIYPDGLVPFVQIMTLEGIMRASVGAYIVKGAKDEFWAVKESIFEKTYEEVI